MGVTKGVGQASVFVPASFLLYMTYCLLNFFCLHGLSILSLGDMMFADFFLQVHDISCADWERLDRKKNCQCHSTELFLWRFKVPYVWWCAETLKINLEDSK